MNFAKKIALLTLFLAALGFSAAAQDRVLKFTLAHEARIGSTTVPAGDYHMVVYSDPGMLAVVMPENRHGSSVVVLPTSHGFSSSCANTSLTLTRRGSQMALTSVCFSDIEMTLYFTAVHGKKSEVAAQTTDAVALAGAQ